MSSFTPGVNNSNGSNLSFFERINQLRSQRPGQRITFGDLVTDELERTDRGQPARESETAQPSSSESDEVSRGRRIETGRDQDVTVQGDNFIALGSGEDQRFTRSVSLQVDSDGNVTDNLSGRQLKETVQEEDGETRTQGIQLTDQQRTSEARATTEASLGGNISEEVARGDSIEFEGEFTNSSGETETVNFRATRTGDNEFRLTAQDPETGGNALQATVTFNAEGEVSETEVSTNDRGFRGLSFGTQSGENIEVDADSLDLSSLSFGTGDGETTVGVTSQNGRQSGDLRSLTLTEDGRLQGQFSNGETRTFGEVATAEFEDPSALTGLDNGQFLSNGVSGEADFSSDAEFRSGELETQGSENTRRIADNLLGNGSGQSTPSGSSRDQLLGAVFDVSV